ncbi:MAG: zinc-dependent metalloprotease family protein [Dokdonella sp.]
MLVLFDEAARMQAQMIPTSTCTDVNDIIGLVIDNIEETDQVFKNSQMPVRVGVVTIAKLNGFSIIPNDPADPYRHTYPNLTSIRTSASVAALRNAVGADAVTFMTDTQAHLGVCGVAYIQRNVCDLGYADAVPPSPCIGAVFAPWMFNAVTVECTSGATDNFEHELGHLMGGDHDPPYAAIPSWQSYPFAFGLSLSGQFQTVMAQQFGPGGPDPQRILYFSNPNVYFGGIATGNASAANAIAMTNLAPGVEAFRARPEVVFANGFDAVSACPGITY